MRTRYLVSGILAAALISSPAFAQTSTPPAGGTPKADVGSPKLETPHWRSSKLIGVNIYNDQNEKLGDINEIILDKEGKVLGYVIGVGGFLGMGEHDILVEPSKIKFVNEPARSASTTTNTNANRTTTGNNTNTTATNTTPPPAGTNANAPTNTRNASNTSGNRNDWYPDHGVLNATKDQLKAMPQFKYSNYNG
jgi:sporulation protein YlmC with PRC-barrel domain